MAFAISAKVGVTLNVKCRICGEKIDRNIAYRVTKGKINMYYCSEKEYIDDITKKAQKAAPKNRLNKIIEEFIGKTENTALYKEISLWLNVADYDTISDYLTDNKDKILTLLNKDFVSEYAKIRYFSAIIKNSIGDYKPKKPEIVRPVETEIYEVKFKPKSKRKCLADYEDGE